MNKKDKELLRGLEKKRNERHDVQVGRADQSTYLHKIDRSVFADRGEWSKAMHAKGMRLEDILRGSGLTVAGLYSVLGLNPDDNPKRFAELLEFKKKYTTERV